MERNELLSRYAPTNSRVVDIERELAEAHSCWRRSRRWSPRPPHSTTYQALEGNLAQATVDAAAQRRVDAADADRRHPCLLDRLDQVGARTAASTRSWRRPTRPICYTRKQEQARLGSALDASHIVNMAVIEPAVVPDRPVRSHGLLLVLLAGIMSLGLGVTAALVLELLDPTIRGARDAEAASGLPVLGSVPV